MIVAKTSGRSPVLILAYAGVALLVAGSLIFVAWPSGNPDQVWERAKVAFEARQFPEAKALMARLGKLRSPTADDYTLKAQLAMADDRVEEAIQDLSHVPDDHRMASQARLQAGQLELRRSRFLPAEAYFKKALEIEPGRTRARRELVYIYGMQLRRAELDATFRALSQNEALTFSEVFLWCLTRGVTWEASEIVATLARCLKADPSDRWARLGVAESLRELSRLDEAEDTLSPLPASDPDARAARVRLALARGEDAEVESLLDAGPPDHLGLALLRGQLALVRNDAAGALRHYRTAYKLAPHQREAVFGLGQALQLSGDAAGAAPLLAEARKFDRLASLVAKAGVKSNQEDPALMRDLGAACADLGRIPEARAWYDLAISQNPSDVEAQQALGRLPDVK